MVSMLPQKFSATFAQCVHNQ